MPVPLAGEDLIAFRKVELIATGYDRVLPNATPACSSLCQRAGGVFDDVLGAWVFRARKVQDYFTKRLLPSAEPLSVDHHIAIASRYVTPGTLWWQPVTAVDLETVTDPRRWFLVAHNREYRPASVPSEQSRQHAILLYGLSIIGRPRLQAYLNDLLQTLPKLRQISDEILLGPCGR